MSPLCLPTKVLAPAVLAPPFSLLAEGGINLFYGNKGLRELSILLTGWRLANNEAVLVLDGGQRFDSAPLMQFAKEIDRDPDELLKALSVSQALTCYQMESLVFQQRRKGIAASSASLVVLDAPLETFYDEEVPFQEAKSLLGLLMRALQTLSPGCTVVILSPIQETNACRQKLFLSYLKTCAHRIFETTLEDEGTLLCLSEKRPGNKQWQLPLSLPGL